MIYFIFCRTDFGSVFSPCMSEMSAKFLELPTINDADNEYVWNGFEIKLVPGKVGVGVFAIKEYYELLLPYGGVEITCSKRFKNI